MAAHIHLHCTKSGVPATEIRLWRRDGWQTSPYNNNKNRIQFGRYDYYYYYNNDNSSSSRISRYASLSSKSASKLRLRTSAVDRSSNSGGGEDGGSPNSNPTASNSNSSSSSKKKGGISSASASASGSASANYVVPLEKSSSITRPLNEILRDLNKRIPDNIIKTRRDYGGAAGLINSTFLPWYHANRMLSFYAPGWCGEIRDVIFSDNGTVTVVYRVTIRGSDDEAFRESTGTVSSSSADGRIGDPVAAAEEIAFCRACARFGLGLYLYHEE